MLTSSLIVSRQSARYVLPSLNPRPFRSCRFFSLNPYLLTSLLHQCPKPEVTKSPVVDPLSIQHLTKCFSHNSFVFMTIHFDGGVCVPISAKIRNQFVVFFSDGVRSGLRRFWFQ